MVFQRMFGFGGRGALRRVALLFPPRTSRGEDKLDTDPPRSSWASLPLFCSEGALVRLRAFGHRLLLPCIQSSPQSKQAIMVSVEKTSPSEEDFEGGFPDNQINRNFAKLIDH